jgi:hypothetical protein
MQSKIKSFEDWLSETFPGGREAFSYDQLAAMSFAYESGKAETLKHVLKQVEKDE